MDLWDTLVEGATYTNDTFIQPALEFVDKNEALINIGITGATAYYGYKQQSAAISAQEDASARALSLQEAQYETEKRSMQLQTTNESATINLISNMSSSSGSINDFLYDMVSSAKTTNVGLGLGEFEKKLELV